jgi:GAF domain-containing protein
MQMTENQYDSINFVPDLVRQMLSSGVDRGAILAKLTMIAENISGPDTTASILVLDEEGLLRNGASPNLPADYLAAIDKLKPDPNLGTCAAAAATGEVVMTPDFSEDAKWAELKHLPMALGYIGAWSVPIKAGDSRVIGTFGIYFRSRRFPSLNERKGMAVLVHAASIALTS